MPRRTNLAKAPRPKAQTKPQVQELARVPSPPRRDEIHDIPPARAATRPAPKPPASRVNAPPPARGDGRAASAAPAPGGFTPKMLAGVVGIGLAIVGQAMGSEPKPEETLALAECMAAVANKYPVMRFAEEIALVTTVASIMARMYIDGKEARVRAKSSPVGGDRPEGERKIDSAPSSGR